MEKRTIWASGLVVLLFIGVVSVFVVSAQTDEGNNGIHFWGKNKHSIFGKGFKSHSGVFDDSAKLDKFKEQLNLSKNATKEDVLATLKEKKATWEGQHAVNFREKLGLSEDVSDGDVKGALQKWREENKDSLFGHGMRGFKGCGK